jgi:hypothetical protein
LYKPVLKKSLTKATLLLLIFFFNGFNPILADSSWILNQQELLVHNYHGNPPSPAAKNTTFSTSFNKAYAYNLIQQQLMFGYRIPGTTASRNCVAWIVSEMFKYGSAAAYNFTVGGIECQNVIAKVNQGHEKIVVFAAHFDSRKIAEKDPDPVKRNDPVPGANDGASGVAMMMEIARQISWSNIPWKYEFWFLFFDAEDQGSGAISGWDWCEGSKWMADQMHTNPSFYFPAGKDLSSIHSFILFDMVGGTNLQFIIESQSNYELRQKIFSVGNELGYSHAFPQTGQSYSIIDDHVPFIQKGVPAVDLIIKFWDTSAGWPYHHTTSDSLENISQESLYITGHTILTFLSQVYDPDANPPPDWRLNNLFLNWFSSPINIAIICSIVGLIIFGRILGKRIEKRQLTRLMKEEQEKTPENENLK